MDNLRTLESHIIDLKQDVRRGDMRIQALHNAQRQSMKSIIDLLVHINKQIQAIEDHPQLEELQVHVSKTIDDIKQAQCL